MKKISALLSLMSISALAFGQSVPTAYSISQSDLRGTARFMSMGGAFTALGGDLSTISQNPGGIGIYRSNEVGFTLALDALQSESRTSGFTQKDNMTRFNLNNIGAVFTLKLYNSTMPNMNFGFTYNKGASFNRRFRGVVGNLPTSISNYIAGVCDANHLTEADVHSTNNFDPYNPPYGSQGAPWLSIMGYDALLVNPEGDADNPKWYGQFGNGTTGAGMFDVYEKGSVDEYNIAVGGNIMDVVYWGMDFDITSVDYRIQSVWGESLDNAYVYNPNTNRVGNYSSDFAIYDNYKLSGTGFNFKFGLIAKPIQELRIGFAFHTPTFYNLNEAYYDNHIDMKYPFSMKYSQVWANDGYPAGNSFDFRTPWRITAGIAGVIAQRLIVSADYEWAGYSGMRYSEADSYGYYDPWYDWDDPWSDWGGWYDKPARKGESRSSYMSANDYANTKIKQIYKDTNTLRIGAEFRVVPSFSVRAGYSYSSSPVRQEVIDGRVDVPGTGLTTSYSLDNATNYITCGLGYKHKGFYIDLAYVYKHKSAEYYPFSPDTSNLASAVKSKINFDNSQVALSLGFKF